MRSPKPKLILALAGTWASFGLPLEGVAILLGIDELVDMVRTTVNVVGNCLASVVIAKWEKKFVPAESPVFD